MFGYYRLASAVPQLRVAEVDYNVDQLTEGFRKAAEQQAAAVVFPELCITGYSCGDLFFQPRLREAALDGLRRTRAAQAACGIWREPGGYVLIGFRSVGDYLRGLLEGAAVPGSQLDPR